MQLDPWQQTILALGLMSSAKPDLVGKGRKVVLETLPALVRYLRDGQNKPKINDHDLQDMIQILFASLDASIKPASRMSLIFVLRQLVNDRVDGFSESISELNGIQRELANAEDTIGPLAMLFQLSGPQSTASDDFIKDIFAQVRAVVTKQLDRDVAEKDIAEVIMMMSLSADGSSAPWNGDLFGAVTAQILPSLDWKLCFRQLDHPLFQPRQMASFRIVVGVFTGAGQRFGDYLPFLWDWTSAPSLIAVIQLLSYAPSSVTGLLDSPYPLILTIDDFAGPAVNAAVQADAAELSKQTWNSLKMVESILKLTIGEIQMSNGLLLDFSNQNLPGIQN